MVVQRARQFGYSSGRLANVQRLQRADSSIADWRAAAVVSGPVRADTARMELASSLTNQLLIAMPGLADPNFSSTVTLICEHSDQGALGIVINRPLTLQLGGLFEQLEVTDADPDVSLDPVLMGGPVSQERGFVLHDSERRFENSITVSDDILLTLSRDVIDAMATGSGPQTSLVALGCAGWEAGQLEYEMAANSWINVPASPDIVFEIPFEDRWTSAARKLGIDISRISSDAGHA
jgi:putative transcriptional regulator